VFLGIFLKFLGFSEYFWCFKNITRFFWNYFHIKNKFEKNPILSFWAEPVGPTRSGPAAARLSSSGPRPRPWPVSMADKARSPGRRRRPSSASVPCTTRSAPYIPEPPQAVCALTLAAALCRLRKTPPPEPQARCRPSSIRRREAQPGEAASTRNFARSSCASSSSSRHQSSTGVPPPSRATTGRPCSTSPATCHLPPLQGEHALESLSSSSSFSLTYPSTW
jgi:hypothetical protein